MTEAAARFDRLYRCLRDRICLLDAPPGTRLSEEALAAEFGTSRTPVRRVLARLESEGLVEARAGVGTLVTDVDAEEMAQVYALRLELTQLAGRLSPRAVDAATLARADGFLREAHALQAEPDARVFARLNMAFHELGLSLCGNAALRETLDRLYARTARIWLQAIPQMDLAEECRIFTEEIRQTRDALAVGDLQAAALIRRTHVSLSHARLRRFAPLGPADTLRDALPDPPPAAPPAPAAG